MQGFSGVWYSGGVGLDHMSTPIRQEGRDQFRPGSCGVCPEWDRETATLRRDHCVSSPGLTELCDCKRPLNLQLLSHRPHLLFAAPVLRQAPVSCVFQALHMYAPRAFLYLCAPTLSLSFHNSSRWAWFTTHRPYTPSVGSSFQQIFPNCLNFTGRQRENEKPKSCSTPNGKKYGNRTEISFFLDFSSTF